MSELSQAGREARDVSVMNGFECCFVSPEGFTCREYAGHSGQHSDGEGHEWSTSAPAAVERPKALTFSEWARGDVGEDGLMIARKADAYMDAQAAEIARLRAQLEAKPASLPYTLRANLESALSAFNAARAEDGWEPVTLVIPEGDKPQPEQHPDDAFLQYCLTSGVPDTCRPYCLEAFNVGARIASRQAKPQPAVLPTQESVNEHGYEKAAALAEAGLPYTLEECAEIIAAIPCVTSYFESTLRDVVTSLRGMAK